MVQEWVKVLDGLCGINEPRLEDKISALLKDGETYRNDPEKHKDSIALLGQLIVAHAKYCQVKDRFGDMFGDYLEVKEIQLNEGLGQFFTPQCITQMMAAMTLGEDLEGTPKSYSDPAAGTGRFMLAIAKHYAEHTGRLNFIVYNTDLDYRAFVFCVMNAVLNGIPSVTVRGDSLAMKFYEGFVTVPLPYSQIAEWHSLAPERILEIFTVSLSKSAVQVQRKQGQLTLLEAFA